jgi:hypothetical protein
MSRFILILSIIYNNPLAALSAFVLNLAKPNCSIAELKPNNGDDI